MAIDQNSGEQISVAEAQTYVQAFRKSFTEGTKGVFIGANHVQRLLDQNNCMGLRIYFGYDEKEGRMNLVMLGVNGDEKDMTNIIMERMTPCPADCDPTSPLI